MRKVDVLNNKIKQKEKILSLGNIDSKFAENTKELSDYKIESIKAKLAILDGFNSSIQNVAD